MSENIINARVGSAKFGCHPAKMDGKKILRHQAMGLLLMCEPEPGGPLVEVLLTVKQTCHLCITLGIEDITELWLCRVPISHDPERDVWEYAGKY